jgi:hypothetical protein
MILHTLVEINQNVTTLFATTFGRFCNYILHCFTTTLQLVCNYFGFHPSM